MAKMQPKSHGGPTIIHVSWTCFDCRLAGSGKAEARTEANQHADAMDHNVIVRTNTVEVFQGRYEQHESGSDQGTPGTGQECQERDDADHERQAVRASRLQEGLPGVKGTDCGEEGEARC